MDQPRSVPGVTAAVRDLMEKQPRHNASKGTTQVGLGISDKRLIDFMQIACSARRVVPDNQPDDKITKENNGLTEKNKSTTSDQVPKNPVPTTETTAASTSCVNVTSITDVPQGAVVTTNTKIAVTCNKNPPSRSRSFSEVMADIKSRNPALSQTVTKPPSKPGILKTKPQAVTPETHKVFTGPQKGIRPNTSAKNPPSRLTKQEVEAEEAQRFSNWIAADSGAHIPNPRFVVRNNYQDTRIFANETCKVNHNRVLGKRLVLFSDGSGCHVSRTASAAVVYQRIYDLDATAASKSNPNPKWITESYGILRLSREMKFETIALMAALDIVQTEAKTFFTTPKYDAGDQLEPLRVYIFSDAEEAIDDLRRIVTNTVKYKERRDPHIMQLRSVWMKLEPILKNGQVRLELHWVKGHNGAHGNKLADKLATRAMTAAKNFAGTRPASSHLGQGYEVFSLEDMERDMLARAIARRRGGAAAAASTQQPGPGAETLQKKDEGETREKETTTAREDSLKQINKMFADFFQETRKNSEKQHKLAEKQNQLALDEVRKELAKQSLQQEAQTAQAESTMMALEELTDEWRKKSAAQSLDVKAFRKVGEEMLRTLREETEEAIRAVVTKSAVAVSSSVVERGVQTEVYHSGEEEEQKSEKNASSSASLALSVEPTAPGPSDVEKEEDVVVVVVAADPGQDGTVTSCGSSGETVVGETKAEMAGSDIREDGGGNFVKKDKKDKKRKLRLRVAVIPATLRKSARKLRMRFAGAGLTSGIYDDSRS